MGGVGNGEMWRQPYTQTASMNTNMMTDFRGQRTNNPDLNETCCAYNLAKLTKDLNCFDPDDARYMDYYERVMYNQLVGSVHPEEYGVCYQYAVGLNATKPFGSPTPQETCCGGTGAENHVKYQEATYFANENTLYVGLYLPTEARWGDVSIKQECEWPAEHSRLTFSGGDFALKLRVPYWAVSGFDVRLNGKSIAKKYQPCSYVEIPQRQWSADDVVEVIMPFCKHIFYAPDKMDQALVDGKTQPYASQWVGTLMYGPMVMTSPDIHTWEEASVSLSPALDELTETGKAPYTLAIDGKQFLPDYYVTREHTTHYLRLNIPSGSAKKAASGNLDLTVLKEKLQMARERKATDWAPHGFKRLQEKIAEAEELIAKTQDKNNRTLVQEDIDYMASSLNVAIISMRPGNLAEPEDLTELTALIEQVRQNGASTPQKREALNYARMVVRYVNDGSGTKDMITKAIEGLKK